jgi:hypothetical protein
VLQLWWGMTEQTYLYYWHHDIWAVLVLWAILLLLIPLVGEEFWRAGYMAALRSVEPIEAGQPSPPRRRFLASVSEAFPWTRSFFSARSRQSGSG